jgi:hypothetical protein
MNMRYAMTATCITDSFGLRGLEDVLKPSFNDNFSELHAWTNLGDVHVMQPRRRGDKDETTCVLTLVRHDDDSWISMLVVTTTSAAFAAALATEFTQQSTYLGTPNVVLAGAELTSIEAAPKAECTPRRIPQPTY